VRPVRRAFAGTLTARMAQTMIPLTLLLLFRQRTGSFAAAGLVVAGAALVTRAASGTARRTAPVAAAPRRSAALAPWLAVGAAQMAAIGFVEVAAAARVS
jgi:hypothetical protein